ncbi:MAG: DNA mismatch endonuclease Vsr [Chloroflexi bacterium]|nr:DNA mismatch endonuclease Vsr [Chloroflexota bacterium]
MADYYTAQKRSEIMRRVRARSSRAELMVRQLTHRMGYRYRLHRRDLPGRPDLVFAKSRKVIFVHGCFWHGHSCRSGQNRPKSNTAYWEPKLTRNMARDVENLADLARMGWQALVVWECELRDVEQIREKIKLFLSC